MRNAAKPWADVENEVVATEPSRQPAAVASDPIAVSVIVSTFKRPDILGRTIGALTRSDYPGPLEIIVVDGGSNDGTEEVVRAYANARVPVKLVVEPVGGVATARNSGARAATGEILIFVDDDIVAEPDMVRRQVLRVQQFRPCLVNGTWDFPAEMVDDMAKTPFGRFRLEIERWRRKQPLKPLIDNCFEADFAAAYNLGVFREDFDRIGGFDETFPNASAEDMDFSLRATQMGFVCVHDFDLQLMHNDRRLTFEDYCARLRRGATAETILAQKYAHYEAFRGGILRENGPMRRGDGLRLSAKKMIKRILSAPPLLRIVHSMLRTMERRMPLSSLLPRMYWAVFGLHLYAGVHEGIARFGAPVLRSRS